MTSKIEWTDETWNVVTGCDRVSPGCDNCYIERTIPFRKEGRRFDEHGRMGIRLHPDRLDKPMHWRKPRRVFVNSLADLFHKDVPYRYIRDVFNAMRICNGVVRAADGYVYPSHTFQVLTKRPQRMAELVNSGDLGFTDPPPNVWLGVSVENQRYADLRIPHLLATPAAVRFLSIEPLLGPVVLRDEWLWPECRSGCGCRQPLDADRFDCGCDGPCTGGTEDLDDEWRARRPLIGWVIVGGESGPGARPMHPDWVRDLRDQCETAEIPFFFKQWGEWGVGGSGIRAFGDDGEWCPTRPNPGGGTILCTRGGEREHLHVYLSRHGKKAAGRELDGRTWDEYPQAVSA